MAAAQVTRPAPHSPYEIRGNPMSILINKDTKVITQGITGKTGQFHTRMCRRLRERQELLRRRRATRRRPARTSKASRSTPPSREAAADHRRHRQRDLRAAGRRGRRDLGSGRGRPRPGDLHHRRHSGARHARGAQPHEGQGSRGRQEDAAARPELPGADHARRDQDRHHAGPHPPQGPHRRGLALGHADLRSGGAADRDRPRPVAARWASAATRSTASSTST